MAKMNLNQFGGKGPARRINPRAAVQDEDEFVRSGRWVPVISSNVKKIMYERAAMRLWVRFIGPPVTEYHYNSVTPALAKRMFRSASMGRFVWFLRRNGFVGIKS